MSQERAREIEELIATLPGMKRSWHNAPHDFSFVPQNEKIEFKYSAARCVPHPRAPLFSYSHDIGFTFQFLWSNIARREFQWLLLSGEDEERLYFWLLPERTARRLLSKSSGGSITFVPKNAVSRRRKAAILDCYHITFEQLRERCLKGDLTGSGSAKLNPTPLA